jgi:putative nucleotidyltransferase with HDIG domain
MVVKQQISREQAMSILKMYNSDCSDLNHYLESEAIMRLLARRLNEDVETWGLLGLMHDVDWGITKENISQHLTKAPEILSKAGFTDDFIQVVISHGYGYEILTELANKKRTQKVEYALACAETITGLIHAYSLMRKTIEGMDAHGLLKKFKDKKFAAGVDREIIKECEHLNLSLEEFFTLAIEAIKSIKDKVGLN